MSQTEPTFVTEDTYRSYRDRQDSDIRKAFIQQASLIENGNRQLTATFNNKLSNVNGTLSGRIGELSHEVQKLKSEVSQVKVRMNGTKSRLYDKIEMYGKIVPGVGYQMPLYVPKNAGEFWKLKRDATASNIRRLIYLVEFYNIDDYQHWHRTQFDDDVTSDLDDTSSDDGQSSSDSALSDLSLEEAVQRYPSQAVEKVATALGLVEENFERAPKYQHSPRRIEKRLQPQVDRPIEDTKRQRIPLRPSPQAPKPTLTLSQVMPDSKSDSLEFDETRLEYDDSSSAARARAKMIRKLQSGPQSRTPSITYPDGSPTEPNESPNLQG
ncbi:hypothetical protein DL98DRAFT_598251 [Cadophora sp. DSE1049]|nr:hypothetical protein DL98DRAFT_598251 [Cadophora sp. DSE1049]